ncbi:NUDIX domain-containing protein [Thalassotalea aquiviva]|uniref:NUDIX domain-containing protein n=1 Tax=Thalassotalea aquiviva TaxID=3242415 RepID=UPI00352A40B6
MKQFKTNDYDIVAKKTIFERFFKVDLYQVRHKLFAGGWSQAFYREVLERGEAVMLIPYDPVTDQLLLIEQFRIGAANSATSPWLLEFIAGMIGEGETASQVAVKEAQEEANLVINEGDLQSIMSFYTSPGGTSEKIHLFYVDVDSSHFKHGQIAGLDCENEDIRTHVVSLEQALGYLAEGKINNASTIIGLQWLALNKGQL